MAPREQWTSKLGFILAAAGSAIGLGAIWKFPYMAGTNGGSIFVLLFIISTIAIGLPILLAEFVIGRMGQADAFTIFQRLGKNKMWPAIAWLGFAFGFIVLSFYSVVGGWILSYLARALTGQLTSQNHGELFSSITSNPIEVLLAQFVFMFLTVWIVQGGIKAGIERASRWMMPLLFIFFIILAIRSLTLEGAMEGVRFLFIPDWSLLTGSTFLLALGQAFFSLSVGVTAMMTYASYLPKDERLGQSAVSVSVLNIFISILAGLVIFPAVFALGGSPAEGPGLIFVILPAIFEQMPFGSIFMILFFILMLFATLTSAIALLEIVISTGIRTRYDRRRRASWVFGTLIFIIGFPSALSFGLMSDVSIFGGTFFDFADLITSRIGMPIGALFISLFAGFVLTNQQTIDELKVHPFIHTTWKFLVRFVVPAAIIVIFAAWIIEISL
ncbi:sodium-dependent transporter [Sporosarcina pasteurii]|uniref:Na+-dependent transporters of the SNF family n=1 Tax=Sporosarcina pasteurii TaxID=1474 RepID=A0A380CA34_SPOPA|nr:sodium-dependent transporter [Sporosarcina pasteurii]MDS9472803.1 sodium-dependent transporter [Sporosarcina pasteurii]QBQ04454.1 sodium-dependent transporter [Sporosarcina pasteurii]SUJ14962.1 Na+-dependent transporters of the SNF family [Sporosarcina pasteurii]